MDFGRTIDRAFRMLEDKLEEDQKWRREELQSKLGSQKSLTDRRQRGETRRTGMSQTGKTKRRSMQESGATNRTGMRQKTAMAQHRDNLGLKRRQQRLKEFETAYPLVEDELGGTTLGNRSQPMRDFGVNQRSGGSAGEKSFAGFKPGSGSITTENGREINVRNNKIDNTTQNRFSEEEIEEFRRRAEEEEGNNQTQATGNKSKPGFGLATAQTALPQKTKTGGLQSLTKREAKEKEFVDERASSSNKREKGVLGTIRGGRKVFLKNGRLMVKKPNGKVGPATEEDKKELEYLQ